jgi:hypothetical protein
MLAIAALVLDSSVVMTDWVFSLVCVLERECSSYNPDDRTR